MSLMAPFRLPPVSSPQWAAPSEQSQNGVMGHSILCHGQIQFKGLITVGRELRQQHPSDLLSGAGTSRERSSRDVPAGQQITRVLLP